MPVHAFDRLASERSQWLKAAAQRHGFLGAGLARAQRMDEEARRLEAWLSSGHHGKMAYMANHFDLRIDPTQLVPGAKSVISLLFNYFPGESGQDHRSDPGGPEQVVDASSQDEKHAAPLKISRYAYGEDYHRVLRRKVKALVHEMRVQFGDFAARVFVDSAPVLERDWARRSGQGWMGKNTMMIHPRHGSYFFLTEIILDLEFAYDHPIRDHCGTCRRCIDACPTEAISSEGYVLDASKCISYLTIELKEAMPKAFAGKLDDWIFGCDICQEVCPWNRFSTRHTEEALMPPVDPQAISRRDWLEMTEDIFTQRFGRTPLKRAGLEKLKDTIRSMDSGE